MVIPCVVAAKAAGTAANVGATALGIGMGKSDLELSRDIFQQQMRQTKRLWTADWAENSARHGESILQAQAHHTEAQRLAQAALYQAEKLTLQSIQLARDQDARSYEMAWRAEVRESLRDELGNQNNRFNIIMLCDTVCLGCVFTLIADGAPPQGTSTLMLNIYVLCLGMSIMLFSISLWGSIVVVRRLHDNTAARLERKLFAQSDDLQVLWQSQYKPTGPQEIYLVHQSYEKWVVEYIDPIGKLCIDLLCLGVVAMFITSGLLVHNVYLIDYDLWSAVPIFWSTVGITCTTMLYMKYSEDNKEKKKEGVYDVSWQDDPTTRGPFAKISKIGEQLFTNTAVELGSSTRIEALERHEQLERQFSSSTAHTEQQQQRMAALHQESRNRVRIRKELLALLTTATEELDALPEELSTRTNKLLHLIDESDTRTAQQIGLTGGYSSTSLPNNNGIVATNKNNESQQQLQNKKKNGHQNQSHSHSPMHIPRFTNQQTVLKPIDAQRLPVSLCQLRKKLGEISHTTLLRLRNRSNEPLRLQSGGIQLKEGRYIRTLNVNVAINSSNSSNSEHDDHQHHDTIQYHLYPGTELPPHSEVLVAARSTGGAWFPTSGIDGKIMYSTRDERWNFKVSFRNELLGNVRRCKCEAYRMNNTVDASSLNFNNNNNNNNKNENENEDEEEDDDYSRQEEYWKISKDEYDSKANNEIIISFDVLHGKEAATALFRQSQATSIVKCGVLLYKKKVPRHFAALGRHPHHQWQHRWFVLTPHAIIYSRDRDISLSSSSNKKHYNKNNAVVTTIALTDIERVCPETDNSFGKKHVFQIRTTTTTTKLGGEETGTSRPYYLSANSVEERDEWIRTIRECIKLLAPSSSSGRKSNRFVDDGDHANTADADANSTCRSGSSEDGLVTEEVDYSIECIHHHDDKTEVVQTIV